MTSLILILSYFLAVVHGAAAPAPTAPARLAKRQNVQVGTIWSPAIVGTTVTYEPFGYNGASTVQQAGSNWAWCASGVSCLVQTSCSSGTIFYPGTSQVCTSAICGVEYLVTTQGAAVSYTRPACFNTASSNGPTIKTFFVVSPASAVVAPTTTSTPSTTTSSASSSTTTSSSPTPSPKSSSTPVGPIIGGVIGGLALLALTAVAIAWLLRRRNQHHHQPAPVATTDAAASAGAGAGAGVGTGHYGGGSPPPAAAGMESVHQPYMDHKPMPYDAKHASFQSHSMSSQPSTAVGSPNVAVSPWAHDATMTGPVEMPAYTEWHHPHQPSEAP